MKRLDVWACRSDAVTLSEKLIRLQCVDVEVTPLKDDDITRFDASERIRDCEKRQQSVESALEPLYRYSNRKKKNGKRKLQTDPDDFVKAGGPADAQRIADGIISRKEELEALEKEETTIISFLRTLEPWREYEYPVDFSGTESTKFILGAVPVTVTDDVLDERLKDEAAAYREVYSSATMRNMVFISAARDAPSVLRRLNMCGFVRADFGEASGTAAELIRKCSERLKEIEKEKTDSDSMIRESAKNIEVLETYWDVIGTELAEARLRERLAATKNCVILRGWVPAVREEKTAAVLEKTDCAYELSDPDENDNVPVKLENNAFARNFEWVVAMYSLPAYGTYDPTFIMGICYVILFALMLADVGYGLLLVLGGFLAPKILHLPESTKRAFNMFGFCGIGSIITGVLFGGYFGDLPIAIMKTYFPEVTPPSTLALVVDPVLDPMTFLIIGLAAGVIHLLAGQAVNFAILWREGRKIDAVCDVGLVWVLYAGIALLIISPDVGKWVLISAVAALIITGGRNEKNWLKKPVKGLLALYGLINFGSDVISYARILAIALSGTVLAQVFNILATMVTVPVVGQIVMIVILLIGHVLNLALSALSGFVHTSRLQYIEFFGKFYIDGGRPYSPMLPSSRYTEPKYN